MKIKLLLLILISHLSNLYRARALVYKAKCNAAAQADEIAAARIGN